MRSAYLPLLFALVLISSVSCKEENANNANVENLKILRKSVNFAYKAGNNFLDLIRGSTPPHKPWLHANKIRKSAIGFKLTDLFPISQPFVGLITLIVVGGLFAVLVPIVGFCFCFCRCAGKCGGKIKGMDPKHAVCKRYIYALLLGIISMVQLAGIVLAFINNQLIHDTLTNTNPDIGAVEQFNNGKQYLRNSLNNITEAIKASETSSTNSGDKKIISGNLMNLTYDRFLSVLQNDTGKLNIKMGLQKILTKLMTAADSNSNENMKNYASKFQSAISNFKFENIRPSVREMLHKVKSTDFDDLTNGMNKEVKEGSITGMKLKKIVSFFNGTVLEYLDKFSNHMKEVMKVEYLEYRMYICIGVCCLLLLVVLFFFLGLCFGQCGERPFEDARICNRGVGANLMMAGVAFAFLFTPTIMVFEMALFIGGGSVQTELCRYATNSYDPGVRTLDSLIQSLPKLNEIEYVNRSIFDSVLNKCPQQEPMALAFNLDKNLTSQEVSDKITKVSNMVSKIESSAKRQIVDDHFKAIEKCLEKIVDESNRNQLTELSSEISSFSLETVKDSFRSSLDNAFEPALRAEVQAQLSAVYLKSYENVRCDGIAKGASQIIESVCVTFLWPFNGFWYGVGICLIFTIPAIIFAVKLAGLYRRTEKYSADYEEPDYHSYMGFYTNNADNIPMKRPKPAKSNHKNRNSNSNNKESLKQNNPQYLPVYPYDAYE